jgi:phytanoyl-CoA hydroxylase
MRVNDVGGMLSFEQWQTYEEQGYLRLGKVLSEEEITALTNRIDEIMLGKADINYGRLMMQREAGEGYEQSVQSLGFKGATLNYRKIQNLELDPLFLSYIQKSLFRSITKKIYGTQKRVACYRAMFMNKPAFHGSSLVYHQDHWSHLDRDPLLTVWTALDPATRENGCVQVYPGTHRHLMNPSHPSGFLTNKQIEDLTAKKEPVYLEFQPGEAVLLNNWIVHGSEGNRSSKSRRAFSVCYMDAETVSRPSETFSVIFDLSDCPDQRMDL